MARLLSPPAEKQAAGIATGNSRAYNHTARFCSAKSRALPPPAAAKACTAVGYGKQEKAGNIASFF
jgi:hypothetical protein